jgi:hypothetical protein
MTATQSGSYVAWRVLTRSQLREQPLRVLATIVAIALGVALGSAVYLINTAALGEFDLATRRLIGNADLVVRGPPEGFDEALFVDWRAIRPSHRQSGAGTGTDTARGALTAESTGHRCLSRLGPAAAADG